MDQGNILHRGYIGSIFPVSQVSYILRGATTQVKVLIEFRGFTSLLRKIG